MLFVNFIEEVGSLVAEHYRQMISRGGDAMKDAEQHRCRSKLSTAFFLFFCNLNPSRDSGGSVFFPSTAQRGTERVTEIQRICLSNSQSRRTFGQNLGPWPLTGYHFAGSSGFELSDIADRRYKKDYSTAKYVSHTLIQ